MNDERKTELLRMIQIAMEEIRPVAHEDLIKFNVRSDECREIHQLASDLLKDTERLRRRESTGEVVIDIVLIERYLRRAVAFLRDATEILKPYEDGLPVPSLSASFLQRICETVNEVDLYNGGIKSYVKLGVMHKIVGEGSG